MDDATVPLSRLDDAALVREAFLTRYTGCTLAGYTIDLTAWFDWCRTHHLAVLEVKRAHLELYSKWMLDEKQYALRTIDRRLSTVSGFYRLALEDEYIEKDPARFLRRPKIPSDSPTLGLSYLEFARFLDTAEHSKPDDFALGYLLGMLGLRCTEALSVDIADLSEIRGHRVLSVVGKGGKVAVIPLPVPVGRAIDAAVAGRTTGPILRTRTGARMTRSAVRRAVKRIARTAGLPPTVHPHVLRHTFVTQLLDAGAPLREVQIAARHADPRMTIRYDRARQQLDRHVNYVLAARMAGAA